VLAAARAFVVQRDMDESMIGRPVQCLRDHIKKLFQSRHGIYGENGFDVEFSFIERKTEKDLYFGDYKTAIQPHNHPKNRYSNVLPLEKTRVILSKDNTDGSDYINASYINGQVPGSERAYICTQGPTKNTIHDFWRMVWEQNSTVIVMLTKEVENTKPKCARYWPEEGHPEQHERFQISQENVETVGEVVIRTLLLEDTVEANWRGESSARSDAPIFWKSSNSADSAAASTYIDFPFILATRCPAILTFYICISVARSS